MSNKILLITVKETRLCLSRKKLKKNKGWRQCVNFTLAQNEANNFFFLNNLYGID